MLANNAQDGGPQVDTHVADAPSHRTLLRRGRSLVGLAVNAQIHDVVAADGAVVHDDVPGPQRDCVPLRRLSVYPSHVSEPRDATYLLHLEPLLAIDVAACHLAALRLGRVGHLDIRHVFLLVAVDVG